MTDSRETKLTDRCTWGSCPLTGSILFSNPMTCDPIAHLCNDHAGRFVRDPVTLRLLASAKLWTSGV